MKFINFDYYILRYFPCACAGFYSDKNKIDPHCFSCNNKKSLLKMFKQVRGSSIIEAFTHLKRNPETVVRYDDLNQDGFENFTLNK